MFAFCFTTTAASTIQTAATRPMIARLVRTGLVAMIALFTTANFASAKGFSGFGGGGSGNRGSMAQKFSSNNNPQFKQNSGSTASTKPNKMSGSKQSFTMANKGSTQSFSKQCKMECHEKCHCHHYCYDYPCWYGGCYSFFDGIDLQMMAVRMIDGGNAEQGPMFRAWFRNNSSVSISRPFSLTAMVGPEGTMSAGMPKSSVRIGSMGAGQIMTVDIRLPAEANRPGLPMLSMMIDSHREIGEVNETNNAMLLARTEIQPLETAPKTIAPPQAPETITPPATDIPAPPAPAVTTDPRTEEEIAAEPTVEELENE